MTGWTGTKPDFDFSIITERWDSPASPEQREMAYLRYGLAARMTHARCFVEVACGTGYGLKMVGGSASVAIGTDLTLGNLQEARAFMPSARLAAADAVSLPFGPGTVDVIACLEAIYYIPTVERFLAEAARVLRPGGVVLVTWPNPGRPGFNPSPGSIGYPSAVELSTRLKAVGFQAEVKGAFPWSSGTSAERVREVVRRLAVKVDLIPGSLEARAKIKRLIYRDVRNVSAFDRPVDLEALAPLVPGPGDGPYKCLVGIGRLPAVSGPS